VNFHYLFSLIINYLGLVVAVWLGWYVITRSPRRLISWLTSLTLLSVGGLFLNMVLALNPPPSPANSPGWLRVMFPFWPNEAFESGWVGWLQGWQVIPAIVIWHHVTMLMRPGKMNWWRWSRVALGYLVAGVAIWVQVKTPLLFADYSGNPLYLNTLKPGPLYLPVLILLLAFTLFSLVNLSRSARSSHNTIPKRQFITLSVATLVAGFTGPIAFISAAFNLALPRLILTIFLLIAVILIGYGVARYSALIEGRTIRRDFIYNAVAMGMVTSIYALVTWISIQVYEIPAAAFVFVIMLAIITHNLVDITRRSLDSFFYRQENQQLRSNLRKLANQVGEKDLNDQISLALDAICSSVRATYGVFVFLKAGEITDYITHKIQFEKDILNQASFLVDDVTQLEFKQLPQPLTDASLLIPLYVDTEQVGAIILGRPINSTSYSDDDIERILYPSDRIAEIILDDRKENEYLSQLSRLTRLQKVKVIKSHKAIAVKDVEFILRNMFNFAELGDSPLAFFNLVELRMSDEAVTHLDRGKAVCSVVSETLEKLRPDTEIPRDPPPREWHPYLILHSAYLENKLNRDIMSRLYISEGTFNRTRRGAIRAVARALEEMEASLI